MEFIGGGWVLGVGGKPKVGKTGRQIAVLEKVLLSRLAVDHEVGLISKKIYMASLAIMIA